MDILIEFWNIAFVVFLGLCGSVGLLALARPRAFATVAAYGNQTVYHGVQTQADRTWIDIGNFKSFNDTFGHPLGDAVLGKLSGVLRAPARHTDIIARLGGDEFALLFPDSDLESASHAAERLRLAISDRPLRHEGQEHALTVSIGLAATRRDDEPTSLIKRADSALYAAKQAGRNCSYRYGDPEPAAPTRCT